MSVRRPTHAQLKDIVSNFGMHMSDERVSEFLEIMNGMVASYDVIDAMPDYLPPVDYPRTSGYRPSAEENPLNAWYVKTEIKGAPRGPLSGRTIALKDNVCLSGVPMMNGASTLKGYTPDVDATIVTRILDAGGTITGKAHCEYFCLSGGSHTNATGPVHNPHKMGYSAGGSSSGSGALVGNGTIQVLQFTLLALGLAGSLYTARRIAHRRYATPARRRSTLVPFTILIGVLGALNVVMFLFPMAHRM